MTSHTHYLLLQYTEKMGTAELVIKNSLKRLLDGYLLKKDFFFSSFNKKKKYKSTKIEKYEKT